MEEQIEFFDEVTEPGSGYRCIHVGNYHDFKTPLAAAIADSDNERKFINMLLQPINLPHYDAWLKSTAMRFYEIDYAWKKREHPKRGKFNPDFFIKVGDLILVVEVKGDEELQEPSEENRKKNEYAIAHFQANQRAPGARRAARCATSSPSSPPASFNKFFQSLRDGAMDGFRSELDVKIG